MKYLRHALLLLLPLAGCQDAGPEPDAYGNFEADEMIVSAEANGQILEYQLEEGQTLTTDQQVGRIDSVQLVLKKEQLQAAIRAIAAKSPAIQAQLAVFERQLNANREQHQALLREKKRLENLLKSDAATPKQLDLLNDQINQVERQKELILEQRSATDANLNTQKGGLLAEILPLEKQIAQIDDQIGKCRIVNPAAGTVLSNYVEAGEIATFGKPLYKVANLENMILRAYVAGNQLGNVRIGQQVTVAIDAPDGAMAEFPGTISWISSEAEFTPKIIQTKEERVNLVYAVKVEVENDGALKIGMPGELRWTNDSGEGEK